MVNYIQEQCLLPLLTPSTHYKTKILGSLRFPRDERYYMHEDLQNYSILQLTEFTVKGNLT